MYSDLIKNWYVIFFISTLLMKVSHCIYVRYIKRNVQGEPISQISAKQSYRSQCISPPFRREPATPVVSSYLYQSTPATARAAAPGLTARLAGPISREFRPRGGEFRRLAACQDIVARVYKKEKCGCVWRQSSEPGRYRLYHGDSRTSHFLHARVAE